MLGTNSEANDNLRWPKKTKSKTNCTDAIIEVPIFNLIKYYLNVLFYLYYVKNIYSVSPNIFNNLI